MKTRKYSAPAVKGLMMNNKTVEPLHNEHAYGEFLGIMESISLERIVPHRITCTCI